MDFSRRIDFLGGRFLGCAKHVYHKGTKRQSLIPFIFIVGLEIWPREWYKITVPSFL